MKTTTINAYGKFVSFLMFASGNTRNHYKRGNWNTCELWRHFAWCVITLVAKVVSGALLAFCISYMVGGSIVEKLELFSIARWYHYIIVWAIGFFTLLFALALSIGAVCLLGTVGMKWEERTRSRKLNTADKPASTIAVLYDSWKNKVCSKVEFK